MGNRLPESGQDDENKRLVGSRASGHRDPDSGVAPDPQANVISGDWTKASPHNTVPTKIQ